MAVSKVAPPHISRLKSCGVRRATAPADGQHVEGTHARGQQRLMGVAKSRVGDEQALLRERPFGEFFRAQLEQQLARAGRRLLLAVVAGGVTGAAPP
jgi:hypothetical protein